jgi:hypothetical protein
VFPLSEYLLSVAKTGERKTAADKAALAPHARRQRDLQQQYAERIAEYEADLVAWRKAREVDRSICQRFTDTGLTPYGTKRPRTVLSASWRITDGFDQSMGGQKLTEHIAKPHGRCAREFVSKIQD